ncbi:MAG: bifunctional [glutamate--ammonia ligase]-adenylyl-L-tyrosine phosphorylase/[glutamate--ammonia-ligase] adenylyltransferase, partial [Deltaproteobacteria bacterium]|nr:bifunctional [glutamate--ammonia ligase]-adenylyl-L-tyrosine phosphorylase/[glutamate--ammonia-ligase] adenylyltransferase [Deltaproteobacteria bacterium]
MERDVLETYLARNCPRLSELLSRVTSDESACMLDELLDTPNALSAAGRCEDLLCGSASRLVELILSDRSVRLPFIATVAGSRFLFSTLLRNPDLVESMFIRAECLIGKGRSQMEGELRERFAGVTDAVVFDRVLRLYKEEQYLRIGCRDLAGLADLQEVMAELSDLACACVGISMTFHLGRLVERHGLPEGQCDQRHVTENMAEIGVTDSPITLPSPARGEGLESPCLDGIGKGEGGNRLKSLTLMPYLDACGDRTGIVAIGMGKVSGGELNFSSDLDLIFIRRPEEGRTSGPESVPVVRLYETLVRAVTRSLSDVTEDGFVFRVDLRLRPEGEKGELVPSLSNALDYYLGWGRTWERTALMKAVPIAGDLDLGEEFLDEVRPFVYRKHLDFSTLEDMRAMKQRIEIKLRRKPGLNLKLGQGGIREIEFFVQALQLINAGRTPRVRSASTLKAIALLRETGLLDERTARVLHDAYRFFRLTEHRIQINHQLQTHELPRTTDQQEELARRMGYRNNALAEFLADLDRHRKAVEELFSSLFYQSREETLQRVCSTARRIVECIEDEETVRSLLGQHGFEDPAASYPLLRGLVAPSVKEIRGERGIDRLERLAPLLVEELLNVPEPGKALVGLAGYIHSLHSASGYFSTFLENPATVRFLIRILGESRFFADLLIRHPQAIDPLIARRGDDHPKEREILFAELSERLEYCDDLEAKLDVLRRFRNEELLMIGVRHLQAEIESTSARWLITELAEACLHAAFEIATGEMIKRFGPSEGLHPVPFTILAMGKFGGMEMTYLSDLDVIFIYDPSCANIGRLSCHEWFTRLANRIISILTVPTAEGVAFAIDTRLRPSGNKGPLVCSLDSFREYHRTVSQLWEKQALIKARPVVGPPDLAQEATQIVRECILNTRLSQEDIREIGRLRSRMQTELSAQDRLHVDLKTGHGGLVDVEFFVQGNILRHAHNIPEILCNNTLEAVAALFKARLIDAQKFTALDSGYRFLSNLEDRLRMMEHRTVNRLPLTGEKLKGLAVRLGYGIDGEARLLQDYYRITDSIRTIYSSFFGPDPGR